MNNIILVAKSIITQMPVIHYLAMAGFVRDPLSPLVPEYCSHVEFGHRDPRLVQYQCICR